MWISPTKLVLCVYFTTSISLAYYDAKTNYLRYWGRDPQTKKQLTTTAPPPSHSRNSYNGYYDNLKLRHQSRFPHLDRVNSRIDSMNNNYRVNSASSSSWARNRIRHHHSTTTTSTTTTDEGLFGDYVDYEEDSTDDSLNYGVLEDEDSNDSDTDDLNYEDEEEEADIFNDTDDEDDEDIENEWQAEEPTERPTTTAVPTQMSRFSEYKWAHFGSRPQVEESRRQMLKNSNNGEQRGVNAVLAHFMRVKQEGQCRKPLPKVISVQSEHPDSSKMYTPQCTILYRCSEETGCCNHATRCQYKTRVLVDLYFYTHKLDKSSETQVEKLSFYNHTECECRSKYSNNTGITIEPNSGNYKSGSYIFNSTPENIKKCNCPEEFVPKIRYDMKCTCDCKEDNEGCLQMKKGKEYLSLTDRKCILNDQCGLPICDYGVYSRTSGRCPKKSEKLEQFRRVKIDKK